MFKNKVDKDFEFTDKPSEDDVLQISNHIEGLSKFLTECDTPMTISIQGEWGTGKSSIMKQIMNKIKNDSEDDILNIWFDTWQFSQFSFDEQLPIILLNRLVSKINEEGNFQNDEKEEGTKIINTIKSIAMNMKNNAIVMSKDVVKHKLGITIPDDFVEKEPVKDMYQEIEEFKLKFEEWIDKSNKKRFIIYIDDLDRLVPEKAVELLEVLKIFLDVDKCVFVLAIDHDVVLRGVASKYGFDMNNPKELGKGKDFFDKIIQVPYTVPLEEYNFEEFINSFLSNEKLTNDVSADTFEKLLINSVGKNPRSIKRILNTFKLNRLIKDLDSKENLILFTFMCMQNAYPFTYSYLIYENGTIENNINDLVSKQINQKDLNASELMEELEKITNKRFLMKVKNIVKDVDEKTLEKVLNVSINTFVSRQEKTSRVTEFADLESLLEDYQKNSGKTITYTIEDIEIVENKIRSLSKKLDTEYIRNRNITTILFKTSRYNIAEIFLNVNSFTVECKLGSKLKNDEDINSILEKRDLNLTTANNVTFNIQNLNLLEDKDFMNDLMDIISIIIENK